MLTLSLPRFLSFATGALVVASSVLATPFDTPRAHGYTRALTHRRTNYRRSAVPTGPKFVVYSQAPYEGVVPDLSLIKGFNVL